MALKILKAWYYNSDGATIVEYGLIVAGISIACLIAAFSFGDSLRNVLEVLQETLLSVLDF